MRFFVLDKFTKSKRKGGKNERYQGFRKSGIRKRKDDTY